MADGEIREGMKTGKLAIEDFSEKSLQPASYDMRFGSRLLITGEPAEIDLSKKGSALLRPSLFALVATQEKIRLCNSIAGHIGVKSYYTRKGMVVLSGLQIDPGFEGVLVIGLYNASPRSITLEYLAPFCTVEFHQLPKPVFAPFVSGDEQKDGNIPRVDKDYLRTLETESLSDMSRSLKQLTENVSSLTHSIKTMEWVMGIGFGILGLMVTLTTILVAVK